MSNAYSIIPLAHLKLQPTRQRKEIPNEHIVELAKSIKENGLLHAPIVSPDFTLITGDCRRRALELLTEQGAPYYYNGQEVLPAYVPIIITHLTAEVDLFRIELEENLRRKNLSHVDQAVAIADLHRMNQKLHGPGVTLKDTGMELAGIQGKQFTSSDATKVADALIISQFANDPAVRAARTAGQAARIAKKKIEQEFLASVGAEASDTSRSRHEVLTGSAFDLLPTLTPGSFDVILTDPPYGVDAHKFGGAAFMGEAHKYKDTVETAFAAYQLVAETGYFLCAEEAHAFVFCDLAHFDSIKLLFEIAGWNVWKTPLVWFKGTTAHAPRPEHGPKRTYEVILFASKGDKKVMKLGLDVLDVPAVHHSAKLHPAEKPVKLLEELLSWSIVPGSRVLDPFAGSGPTLEASDGLGCDATLIELDPKYAGIARSRLEMKEKSDEA
jgi:site-specific DNA-methyltransferase (adenine-specific)